MYVTIHPIIPFDGTIGTDIPFTWNGNQIYKVRCIIKENESGKTVYDNTVSSMKPYYHMDSDSGLINGNYYVAFITVFDINDVESELPGTGTPFYCFSTPEFSLSISDGDVLRSSSYEASLTYSQAEHEELNSYEITLYTYQKTLLWSSGPQYDPALPAGLLTNLENAAQYYVRATGETVHGILLDTGYLLFSVSYTQAQVWTPLEINNLPQIGAIEIKSNIVSALGIPASADVTYLENRYVDLTGGSVTYDAGFEAEGDFCKILLFHRPRRNASILHSTGGNLDVNIYYRCGEFADSNGFSAYFELIASDSITRYVQLSNYLPIPDDSQQFALAVNRIGAFYELKAILINK